ncbi:MAG TPA: flagellar basal-body MS-ring/collar protein FliF [Terracidiphilus sp.]|nr:flagellar basal-body MS-ring/collar protein FliF [Terracidiphilus sp.]
MATTGTQLAKSTVNGNRQGNFADRIFALLTRARVRWASMPARQRVRTALALVLVAALAGGVGWYALRTDWRTLYAGMDPEDARQTGLTLTQAQIPFEVSSNGTAILVPAPQLNKARLATAAKGGVKSGRMGFELFDKPNWVGSEFDEQVNYQRALEGELEHTVGTLADVESARVHLVMPHDSLFRDQERPAKASVVLKLRHATLADGEADAIRNLVASAVDDLGPDHVVLVDASGHLPLGPKTAEALRLGAEQALEEKLVSTLEPVTGTDNVRASVTLNYDETNIDETQETYDPSQSATLTMQRSEQTSGGQAVAAGVPGAASNAPNTQALPVYPKQTTLPETAKSESGTYGVSNTLKHVVQTPGQVRRMTVAVVVNDRLIRAATKGSPAQWQKWSPAEVHNLTELAQAAVGFDAARGDVVTVEDLAFDGNRAEPETSMPARLLNATENSPLLVKYTALLIGLLVVLTLGVRPVLQMVNSIPALGNGAARSGELPRQQAAQAALSPPEPTTPDPERIKAQEIFEQVSGHMKREPAQSSRLLQSWIHSE